MKTRSLSAVAVFALAAALLAAPQSASAITLYGAVSAQVVTPGGAAVAKAGLPVALTVVVSDLGETESVVTTTDAFGRATFLGQWAGLSATVSVTPPTNAYLPGTSAEFVIGGGTVTNVVVTYAKAARISGTVYTPAGRTAAGVVVRAIDGGGSIVRAVTTSTSGRYALDGLGTGSYRLQFNARTTALSSAMKNYAWNYWKNASTFAGSSRIAVKQQTAASGASVKTRVNNVLKRGQALTVTTDSFTAQYYRFSSTISNETIYLDLQNGNRGGTVRLPAGSYTVSLQLTGGEEYWYAGPGLPSGVSSGAVPVVITNGPKTITFNLPAG